MRVWRVTRHTRQQTKCKGERADVFACIRIQNILVYILAHLRDAVPRGESHSLSLLPLASRPFLTTSREIIAGDFHPRAHFTLGITSSSPSLSLLIPFSIPLLSSPLYGSLVAVAHLRLVRASSEIHSPPPPLLRAA